jgi:hypothetical protein
VHHRAAAGREVENPALRELPEQQDRKVPPARRVRKALKVPPAHKVQPALLVPQARKVFLVKRELPDHRVQRVQRAVDQVMAPVRMVRREQRDQPARLDSKVNLVPRGRKELQVLKDYKAQQALKDPLVQLEYRDWQVQLAQQDRRARQVIKDRLVPLARLEQPDYWDPRVRLVQPERQAQQDLPAQPVLPV